MKITNLTNEIYTWVTFKSGDTAYRFSLPNGCEWIHPGQTHTLPDYDELKLFYIRKTFNADEMNQKCMSKNYPEPKLVSGASADLWIQGDFPNYCDIDHIRKTYKVTNSLTDVDRATLADAAENAANVMHAVAKFMENTTPLKARGLATFADELMKATASPAQIGFNSTLMDTAIRHMLAGDKDETDCVLTASSFINATASLSEMSSGSHGMSDLGTAVEDFCAAGGPARKALGAANISTSISQRICSAYLLGISAYTRYLWMHFVKSASFGLFGGKPASRLPDLKECEARMKECLSGLDAMIADVQNAVDHAVAESGLSDATPASKSEKKSLTEGLFIVRTGLPNLDVARAVRTYLQDILAMIGKDIALVEQGNPPIYYDKAVAAAGGTTSVGGAVAGAGGLKGSTP